MTDYIQGPTYGKGELIAQAGGFPIGPPAELLTIFNSNAVLVVVVHNGAFEAAAVVDSDRDFQAFNDPSDTRPKQWYRISREAVKTLL